MGGPTGVAWEVKGARGRAAREVAHGNNSLLPLVNWSLFAGPCQSSYDDNCHCRVLSFSSAVT